MRSLHKPIIDGLIGILDSTFNQHRYVDKCIEYAFKKNRKWGSRDRKFVAEAAYDIVRWWRKLNVLCEQSFDRTDYSVDEFKKIIDCWLILNQQQLRLGLLDVRKIEQKNERLTSRAERESVTDWFDKVGEKNCQQNWDETLRALNVEAKVWLRVNTLKSVREKVQASLFEEGIRTVFSSHSETALQLEERKNVFATQAFKAGLFEVQDVGSQMISVFADPKPGMRVIDACAGAGGKSLHMAALMKNKGKIIAMDVHGRKLEELRKRSTRAGIDIIEVREITDNKIIKRLKGTADILLLDVPCTGSGVIRRNPDTKWKLNEAKYQELLNLQQKILVDYSEMLKPDGQLIYSTCSVFKEENESQIEKFLNSQNDKKWKLEKQLNLSPIDGSDGFYMAKLL